MVFYINHAVVVGFKYTVVNTPDTNIIIALLISHSQLHYRPQTRAGKYHMVVSVSELGVFLESEYCSARLG